MHKSQEALALVHTRHVLGWCVRTLYVPCYHAWKAKNSHGRSGSGARARMMNDQHRGHEQAKGVKEDEDIPSKPLYGLDAAGSLMTGVSMWAKITQQRNPKEETYG